MEKSFGQKAKPFLITSLSAVNEPITINQKGMKQIIAVRMEMTYAKIFTPYSLLYVFIDASF